MNSVLGDLLAQGIGVAMSPTPIVAVILMLLSKRGWGNGIAFVAGWVLALAAVGGAVIVLAEPVNLHERGTPTTAAFAARLLLGLVFLLMTAWLWYSRPAQGKELKTPRWLNAIDRINPVIAFGAAFATAGFNPKNFALTVSAAMTIGEANLVGAAPWLLLAVFVAVGSLSIAAPLFYVLIAGESAEHTLNDWKSWLMANNGAVIGVICLIFGVKLVGAGLGGLLG